MTASSATSEVLEQMRDGDCDAWNSVQLRLGERDRELRGE
jgi:hypothetical protein